MNPLATSYRRGIGEVLKMVHKKLKLNARAMKLLDITLIKFNQKVIDRLQRNAKKGKVGVISTSDIQSVIEEFCQRNMLQHASAEGTRALMNFQTGLINYRPKLTAKKRVDTKKATKLGTLPPKNIMAGVNSFIRETPCVINFDGTTKLTLGNIIEKFCNDLAVETKRACGSEEQISPQQVAAAVNAKMGPIMAEHGHSQGQNSLTMFEKGLVYFKLKEERKPSLKAPRKMRKTKRMKRLAKATDKRKKKGLKRGRAPKKDAPVIKREEPEKTAEIQLPKLEIQGKVTELKRKRKTPKLTKSKIPKLSKTKTPKLLKSKTPKPVKSKTPKLLKRKSPKSLKRKARLLKTVRGPPRKTSPKRGPKPIKRKKSPSRKSTKKIAKPKTMKVKSRSVKRKAGPGKKIKLSLETDISSKKKIKREVSGAAKGMTVEKRRVSERNAEAIFGKQVQYLTRESNASSANEASTELCKILAQLAEKIANDVKKRANKEGAMNYTHIDSCIRALLPPSIQQHAIAEGERVLTLDGYSLSGN